MPEAGRTCTLSSHIYPQACIHHAIEEFRSLCSVQFREEGQQVRITITALPGAPEAIADEFLNFLLSASLEAHLS